MKPEVGSEDGPACIAMRSIAGRGLRMANGGRNGADGGLRIEDGGWIDSALVE
jgi:hypothetical protein